jgi:PPOX class probable F420-dependent enzyme
MHHPGMDDVSTLDGPTLAFLTTARRATLATIAPSGRPRLVPMCFVVLDGRVDDPIRLVSPIDDKPKATADWRSLARIRDILARPATTLLVDRWSEDWTRLGWLRLECHAEVVDASLAKAIERATAIAALRAKYPQYREHTLEDRPLLRFSVERIVTWGALDAD